MNKSKLKDLRGYRVRLRRPAISLLHGRIVARRDDEWIVTDTEPGVLVIQNTVTSHRARLGTDHLHQFDSDPQRDWNGLRHGFLTLTVQIYMSGYELWMEPLSHIERRKLFRSASAVTRRTAIAARRHAQAGSAIESTRT